MAAVASLPSTGPAGLPVGPPYIPGPSGVSVPLAVPVLCDVPVVPHPVGAPAAGPSLGTRAEPPHERRLHEATGTQGIPQGVARGERGGCGTPGLAPGPSGVGTEAAPPVPPPSTPPVPSVLTKVLESSPAQPQGSVAKGTAGGGSCGVPAQGDPSGPHQRVPTPSPHAMAFQPCDSLQLSNKESCRAEASHHGSRPSMATVPATVPAEVDVPPVSHPTMDEAQLLAVEELLPAWAEDVPLLVLQSHMDAGLGGTDGMQVWQRDQAVTQSPAVPRAQTASPLSRGGTAAAPETPAVVCERVPSGTGRGPPGSPRFKVLKNLINAIENAPGWRASPHLATLVNAALQQFEDRRKLENTLRDYGWSGTGFPDGTDLNKLASELRLMACRIVETIGKGAYAHVYKVSGAMPRLALSWRWTRGVDGMWPRLGHYALLLPFSFLPFPSSSFHSLALPCLSFPSLPSLPFPSCPFLAIKF